ncbi:hypothetical protein ANCDUO_01600 [Ancylostoma duodenale]|uniref:Conserved oligomeric Golgi complex subunit 1 n=1 Tax=Ancylostoma duodenale TaxID=51022 RepID=A0A0C2H8T9_9BILA|nr:hypothetical protein ANCDUO_01600 [Ancylostoma duodenale]
MCSDLVWIFYSLTINTTTSRKRLLFACDAAKECLPQQSLRPYVDACTKPAHGMLLALVDAFEWERLELDEVGTIEVPIVLSPPLQTALFALSCRLGDVCVAHLLSRSVRKRLAAEVAHLLSLTLTDAIKGADAVQRTWIQLLFDCRVLSTMFPDDRLKKLIPTIESHVDPFDLSLLSSHLATNVRLAVSRSQVSTLYVALFMPSCRDGAQ